MSNDIKVQEVVTANHLYGREVRRIRKEAGLTMLKFAYELHLSSDKDSFFSQAFISSVETGRSKPSHDIHNAIMAWMRKREQKQSEMNMVDDFFHLARQKVVLNYMNKQKKEVVVMLAKADLTEKQIQRLNDLLDLYRRENEEAKLVVVK